MSQEAKFYYPVIAGLEVNVDECYEMHVYEKQIAQNQTP